MKTYISKSISSSSFHHPLTARQHTYKDHVGILEFGNDIIKHLDVVGVVLEFDIDILVVVSQGCQALTYTSIKMRHMHMTILWLHTSSNNDTSRDAISWRQEGDQKGDNVETIHCLDMLVGWFTYKVLHQCHELISTWTNIPNTPNDIDEVFCHIPNRTTTSFIIFIDNRSITKNLIQSLRNLKHNWISWKHNRHERWRIPWVT